MCFLGTMDFLIAVPFKADSGGNNGLMVIRSNGPFIAESHFHDFDFFAVILIYKGFP